MDTLSICFAIHKEVDKDMLLEEYQAMFKGNIHEMINSSKRSHIPDYFEQYNNKTRELTIPLELKKIIQDIFPKHTLAIVSSTPTSSIRTILDREGVSACFTDILGNDVHKSKVVKINMLLEKHKVSPNDAVFITDTVGDILEGRVCGVKSIAVTWGFHEEKTLQKSKPTKMVSTPEDLLKAIQEI